MNREVKCELVGSISPIICGMLFIFGYWIGGGSSEDVYASAILLTITLYIQKRGYVIHILQKISTTFYGPQMGPSFGDP